MQKRKPKASCLQTSGFSSSSRLLDVQEFLSSEVSRGFCSGKTKVFYSCSKRDSELAARHFLDRHSPFVGFAMEWAKDDCSKEGLQQKAGLIQIATQDKVGLFHIGIHPGKTSEDIIAPSLKRLIEDPRIEKVGVDIWNGNFSRLSRWFGLNPKGAIECSHLYRLVKFGRSKPELVTTRLVSLADQVQDQFRLVLDEEISQASFLGRTLKRKEKNHAARNAYAVSQVYRRLLKKRNDMMPAPPMPIFAECYPNGKMSPDDPVLLDTGDGTTISAEEFFRMNPPRRSPMNKQFPALDSPFDAFHDALSTSRPTFGVNRKQPPTITNRKPISPPDLKPAPASSHTERTVKITKYPTINSATLEQAPTFPTERVLRIRNFDSDPLPVLEPVPTNSPNERVFIAKEVSYTPPHDPQPAPTDSLGEYTSNIRKVTSTPPPVLRPVLTHSPAERIFRNFPLSKEPSLTIKYHQSHPNDLWHRPDVVKDKLFNFSKSVASKLPGRDNDARPLVTYDTISLVVKKRPQTQSELDRIPGLEDLAAACEKAGVNLLENIVELAPPLGQEK
ncbi:Ribonuclease H protein [Pyrenophora teres f. maculata]|nr:Ribonuclease H protein [Pyrenophora teres f. maculata]